MPDPSPEKRRPLPVSLSVAAASASGEAAYAELRCRTNFSFLEGASHPDEFVQRAAELGLRALAVTDRHSLAGVVRAHTAAKAAGLKLLIGAEVAPADAPAAVLLATDRAAYGRLCRLLTVGRRRAEKGNCALTFDDVAEHAPGLLACVPLAPLINVGRTVRTPAPATARPAGPARYREVFGDRCYALAELHLGPHDRRSLHAMQRLARAAGLPLVAANDVHYHMRERQYLHDVLTAVRCGCTVAELGARRFPNAERRLKSPAEMAALFAAAPDAVGRTLEVAGRCSFSLDELRYEYPVEVCPPGESPAQYLHRLAWEGAAGRYPRGVPEKVRRLIDHELALITQLRYEAFFLTVYDLVRFARSRGILCQGRGSAANSAVCYCLGVTSVDPAHSELLFERFISPERNEAPDIDVDFEHERREEVIQYVYEKYGRDRAGLAATVVTYRPRSAVRDVGKALGLSLDRVDVVAKALERAHGTETLSDRLRGAGLDPAARISRQLIELMEQVLGFPRHLSQHVGGMVLTNGPLCELVPIENAAMPGRTVIQWDKDDLDALGLLKVDCLALGMLTAIRKCFALVARHEGRSLSLATVPPEEPAVYDMVGRADTVGVFQIESRAQMSMLPRLRPRCFYDLVIEVAIVRPGPIQGDMVHPYLRRRNGEEPVAYPDERIRGVLERTLGVPIFQEQAMKLAVVAAGFTPGEADQLRRAMGAWRRQGIIDRFRQQLLDGMAANGYSADFAARLFQQIRGFGEYGFPESHAASFALLVYVSAWLKRNHPAAFTAALLNSQPMGFYAPAQLIADARKHGIAVRPVDVNHSDWDCTLESVRNGWAVRLGLRMIGGLPASAAADIVRSRGEGAYISFDDFARRTGLSSAGLQRLAQADALQSLALDRRSALWRSLPEREAAPLLAPLPEDEPEVELPRLSLQEEVTADYRAAGLSLKGHPLQFIRPRLEERRIVPTCALARLPVDRRYRIAGLVLLRQRPGTAKGITFVTLEDEFGTANLIIRQEVWERYRRVAAGAQAWIAHGRLQRVGEVIHLLVDRLEDLSAQLAGVRSPSRDFQ